MTLKGYFVFSEALLLYWNFTIKLFSDISRTLVDAVLPLCRDTVCVFYSSSQLDDINVSVCSCVWQGNKYIKAKQSWWHLFGGTIVNVKSNVTSTQKHFQAKGYLDKRGKICVFFTAGRLIVCMSVCAMIRCVYENIVHSTYLVWPLPIF